MSKSGVEVIDAVQNNKSFDDKKFRRRGERF